MLQKFNTTDTHEVMKQADLAYQTELKEIKTADGITMPNHLATTRSDNNQPLGVVGRNYKPIQNSEVFGFIDTLSESFHVEYATVCNISPAHYVIQLRTDLKKEIRPGDPVEMLLTLVNSHDCSAGFHAFPTTLRLACQNQLNRMISTRSGGFSFRHTSDKNYRMQEGLQLFTGAQKTFETFTKNAEALAQKNMDTAMVDEFLLSVFGDENVKQPDGSEKVSTRIKNKKTQVRTLFTDGRGNGHGTAWDLINAVTEYVDHFTKRTNEEKLFQNTVLGTGAELKQRAFSTAMAMI